MSDIVIEFITLDGIVTDPDGSGGTTAGGWAFRALQGQFRELVYSVY